MSDPIINVIIIFGSYFHLFLKKIKKITTIKLIDLFNSPIPNQTNELYKDNLIIIKTDIL